MVSRARFAGFGGCLGSIEKGSSFGVRFSGRSRTYVLFGLLVFRLQKVLVVQVLERQGCSGFRQLRVLGSSIVRVCDKV